MMTWDTVWNISKLLGMCGAFVIAAWIITKHKVVEILQLELKLSREHSEQCDKTVLHYRDEMHATRNECTAEVDKAEQQLKAVEIENASLKAKTDLSPVMETMTKFIGEQTQINGQVLQALERLTRGMKTTNGQI